LSYYKIEPNREKEFKLDGRVLQKKKIYKISLLTKGQFLGDKAVFDNEKRKYSAKVIKDDTEVYYIPKLNLLASISENTKYKKQIYKSQKKIQDWRKKHQNHILQQEKIQKEKTEFYYKNMKEIVSNDKKTGKTTIDKLKNISAFIAAAKKFQGTV